jgi:hypothetical protein
MRTKMVGYYPCFDCRCQQKTAPAVAAEPITATNYYKDKVEKYDTGYDTRSKRSAYFMLPQHFADQAGEMTKTYTVKPLSFAAQMKTTTLVTTVFYQPIIQLPGIWRSFTLKTYYDYL